MHTSEEWRAVAGYEGLYEVSDHGRVRSLDRWIACRNGTRMFRRGRMLRLSLNPKTGYRHVNTRRPGESATRTVHVLVAVAFLTNRSPGDEVCHIDGSKSNNSAENLRWDTPRSNAQDKWTHGTMMHGESHANHVLTSAQVLEIRAASGSLSAIGRAHSVSPATVRDIRIRRTWRWLKEQSEPDGHPCS